MKNLPKDVINEMKVRFHSNYVTTNKILEEYLNQNEYLNSDRIIRCVIFLSNNGIESFISALNSAKEDPRDVIYWAECDGDFENHKVNRIRDFNKTFEEQDF